MRVYAEYTTQNNILSLNPTADIFTSSSTSNGNRRMLFVGTYTDYTVCLPDSCHPIYTESKSFLKFDFAAIPSQYIILSAKLKLFHYGSNDNFDLNVVKVTEDWSENSIFPDPNFDQIIGSKTILALSPNILTRAILNHEHRIIIQDQSTL